jgi:hypothetical protein
MSRLVRPLRLRTSVIPLWLVVFFALLLVYASLRTSNYYWDGIGYAYNIEHADSRPLLHQNHLLYGPLGYILWRAVGVAFPHVRSLTVLQVFSAFCGAAAVAIFCCALISIFQNAYLAVCLALTLSFSATWWKFSTDANSYIPTVLLMLTAVLLITSRSATPVWLGLTHAAAMLLHQLAVFFTPALMLGVWHQQREYGHKRQIKGLVRYATTAAILTGLTYYAAFVHEFHQYSASGLLHWVTSYSQDSTFSFNITKNVVASLIGHVRLFWGGRLPLVRAVWSPFIAFTTTAFVALTSVFILRVQREPGLALSNNHRFIAWFSLVWIGTYISFLLFWAPHNTFYRIFYAPGLVLFAGSFMAGAQQRQYRLAITVAMLFFWNLGFDIYPYAESELNGTLTIAQALKKVWLPGAVVYWDVYAADNQTIQYFNPDVEWKPLWGRAWVGDLQETMDRTYANGKTLWFDLNALRSFRQKDPEFNSWLAMNTRAGPEHEFVNGDHIVGFIQLMPIAARN